MSLRLPTQTRTKGRDSRSNAKLALRLEIRDHGTDILFTCGMKLPFRFFPKILDRFGNMKDLAHWQDILDGYYGYFERRELWRRVTIPTR